MNAGRWLLRHTLPPDELAIVGEIEEVCADRYRHAHRWRAHLGYWHLVLAIAFRFTVERRRERQHSTRRRLAGGPVLPGPEFPTERNLTMSSLLDDVRQALRHLLRRPGFSATVVLILAVGIGPAIAIFTVVNGLLLRPLPYEDPERLGLVRIDLSGLEAHPGISHGEILDLREGLRSASAVEAVNREFTTILGEGSEMVARKGTTATLGFFDLLGVQPILGRSFIEADREERVVLISHRLWADHFGADPALVGETTIINTTAYHVVGVLPPNFKLMLGPGGGVSTEVDLWFPLLLDPESRNFWGFRTLVRLTPEASFAEARADIERLGEEMVRNFPAIYENASVRFDLHPLHEDLVAPVRPALLVLFGAVAMVLLIACNNAAGLLLAGTLARAKELALRQALGAQRYRVLNQVMIESLLLASAAGALGVLAARVGLQGLLAFQPGNLPRVGSMVVDSTVLAFAVGVTFVACLAFGIIPAWQGSRAEAADVLRQGGRGRGTLRGQARNALVVAQVAFSVVLLIGAGLLIRTMQHLQSVDLGFDPTNVLTLRVQLDQRAIAREERWAMFQTVAERVRALPGVTAVGGMQETPLSGRGFRSSYSADIDSADEWNGTTADYRWVLADTLEALGGRLISGRDIRREDLEENRPVAVIDQSLAEATWPGENPIGKRFKVMIESPALDPVLEIVGVMEHPKIIDGRTVPMPIVLLPFSATHRGEMTLLVRAERDVASLVDEIRGAVHLAGTGRPVHSVQPLEALVANARGDARFILLLMSSLAGVAVLLSAAGIYSVLAYLVRQRQHETGVRMALGAARGDILRLNIGTGMVLAIGGVLVGTAGALFLAGWLESVLFGVAPRDPATFAGAIVVIAVVAGIASLVPALRAARVEPALALRD